MKVLIFHGTLGSPEINWFPWLSTLLIKQGWDVSVPNFPTPKGQSPKQWKQALQEQVTNPQDADIVIGHSTGALFAMRLLEEGFIRPQKIILVSGLIDKINNAEYDVLNEPFVNTLFDWHSIKENSREIIILAGDNDPYVPMVQTETIALNLQSPIHIIKNGGHLNGESGYTEFPEILEYLDE